jgi:hypothetical protein
MVYYSSTSNSYIYFFSLQCFFLLNGANACIARLWEVFTEPFLLPRKLLNEQSDLYLIHEGKSYCCNNIIKFRLFVIKLFCEANDRFILLFCVLLSFGLIQISSLVKFASINFPFFVFHLIFRKNIIQVRFCIVKNNEQFLFTPIQFLSQMNKTENIFQYIYCVYLAYFMAYYKIFFLSVFCSCLLRPIIK